MRTFNMTRNPNLQPIHCKILQWVFKMGSAQFDLCLQFASNAPDHYVYPLMVMDVVVVGWKIDLTTQGTRRKGAHENPVIFLCFHLELFVPSN